MKINNPLSYIIYLLIISNNDYAIDVMQQVHTLVFQYLYNIFCLN